VCIHFVVKRFTLSIIIMKRILFRFNNSITQIGYSLVTAYITRDYNMLWFGKNIIKVLKRHDVLGHSVGMYKRRHPRGLNMTSNMPHTLHSNDAVALHVAREKINDEFDTYNVTHL